MCELNNILNNNDNKNSIIIVFANNDYLPVLNNWMNAIKRLDIKNYLIIALDEKLHNELSERNIPAIIRECNIKTENLWIHRIMVIQEILEHGIHVLHSDADAVWFKNPLNGYIHNGNFDMIFSQGTIWPREIYHKWGFVLCCGLFYVKSNTATLKFFDELKIRVEIDKDDQISINKLLDDNLINWEMKDGYNLSYNNNIFRCFNDVITGTTSDMKIALLPHSKFQRVRDSGDDVYIKHIISEKNTMSIMQVLEENDCIFS